MKASTLCRLCHQRHSYKKAFLDLDSYELTLCPFCGFVTLNPLPTNKKLNEIYSNPHYHDDKSAAEHHKDASKRVRSIRQNINLVGPLLDYGAGNGVFLNQVSPHVNHVKGYDLNPHPINATGYNKIKSGKSYKNLYKENSFQIITCFDVIEHIKNFTQVLKTFQYWLVPGGYVCITTPSLDCWDAKLMGKRWYGYKKIPEHINYFNKKTIMQALEQNGFVIESIRQWGFVRSIAFILEKSLGRHLPPYLKALYLDRLHLFIPAVDMMIIAKTAESHELE